MDITLNSRTLPLDLNRKGPFPGPCSMGSYLGHSLTKFLPPWEDELQGQGMYPLQEHEP